MEGLWKEGNTNVAKVAEEASADAGNCTAMAHDELSALSAEPFIAPDQTSHGRVLWPSPQGRIPNHLFPGDRMCLKLQTKQGR